MFPLNVDSLKRTTRRHIPEESTVRNQRCENFEFYVKYTDQNQFHLRNVVFPKNVYMLYSKFTKFRNSRGIRRSLENDQMKSAVTKYINTGIISVIVSPISEKGIPH
jgi:hypothetical protein